MGSPISYKIFLFIISFTFVNSAFAGTVNPNFEDEAILTLSFRCALPTECRKLTQKDFLSDYIMKVNEGMSYPNIKNEAQTAPSEGYYVGSLDHFFPIQQVGATEDGNYYVCENGENIKLEDPSIELSQDLYNENKEGILSLGFCPAFWAPKQDLIPSRPDLIQTTDYLYPPGTPFVPVTGTPGRPTDQRNPIIPIPPIFCFTCGGSNPNPPVVTPEQPPAPVNAPAFPLYYLWRALGLTEK